MSCLLTMTEFLLKISSRYMWAAPNWLVSSVGRALQWYCRGNGFKSCTGLNFFQAFFHYCSNSVHYCEDRFHIHITRIVRQTVRRITNVIFGDIGTREFHMAINWTERWGPFKYPAHLPSEVIYCDNTVSCLIQFIKCFINDIFPGFTHWWLKNYESKA